MCLSATAQMIITEPSCLQTSAHITVAATDEINTVFQIKQLARAMAYRDKHVVFTKSMQYPK